MLQFRLSRLVKHTGGAHYSVRAGHADQERRSMLRAWLDVDVECSVAQWFDVHAFVMLGHGRTQAANAMQADVRLLQSD